MTSRLVFLLLGAVCSTFVAARGATFVVTNAVGTGPGTLAAALAAANTSAAPNIINFGLTGTSNITVTTALPQIVRGPLRVDGTTQPGYAGKAVVILNGSAGVGDGLSVLATNVVIRGLWINGFTNDGVVLHDGYNSVEACILTSNRVGVECFYTFSNMVGGLANSNFNVIAGNKAGVRLYLAQSATIAGNLFGVDPTNLSIFSRGVLPNETGIDAQFASGTTISGDATGQQIIGCSSNGILLYGCSNSVITGNKIGTDGLAVFANGGNGIEVFGSVQTVIGGTNPSQRNFISGNTGAGIAAQSGASGLRVLNNVIGLNTLESGAIPNGLGIRIQSPNCTIGGTNANEGNVICGNQTHGLHLLNTPSGCVVQANFIGVNRSGSPVSNGSYGILVAGSASGLLIGGTSASARNYIGGNASYGLLLGGTKCIVQGNYIGLNSLGGASPNGQVGLYLSFASSNWVGGVEPGAGNVISGHNGQEINLQYAFENVIQGNWIGTTTSGVAAAGNGTGIFLSHAHGNRIGGAEPLARNVIAGNRLGGIGLDVYSYSNTVAGNFVGLGANGLTALGNGTNYHGITDYGSDNIIGGPSMAAGNYIGGNHRSGIELWGTNTVVQNNRIGLATNGTTAAPNGLSGIGIYSSSLTVGDDSQAGANTIAFNTSYGIFRANGITNCALLGNLIYSNILFSLYDAGTNYPAAPIITNATSLYGSTFVQGRVVSRSNTSVRLEFFANDKYVAAGETKRWLGTATVVTPASGTGLFSVVLGGHAPTGQILSATATDSNRGTSQIAEFAPVVTAAADPDLDRMPSYWETLYGLNPAVSNAPNADADLDGATDYQEYIAGTAPNDPTSVLEATAVAAGGGTNLITFNSVDTRRYAVETQTNLLTPGAWSAVVSNHPGSPGSTTVVAPVPTGTFFRVRAYIP